MNAENLVGQTLDGKYKIESEIGRGGMGTVYLALHIGTDRHVAVKVITPQFMKSGEFVERFRREARAAGRLRHPNVVDVTDFGITRTGKGDVAYLVMEYLDGCSLGEILEEEKHLPLEWSLDILEQVSSAVQEAHQQGIIHRDLKPDNIWLEPDRRGGYTVKVLDFGIAKLETDSANSDSIELKANDSPRLSRPTEEIRLDGTQAETPQQNTVHEQKNVTIASEKQTLLEKPATLNPASESATIIQPAAKLDTESNTAILLNSETKILSEEKEYETPKNLSRKLTGESSEKTQSANQLTRVGSVLGTPLYMSPEQCRGEKLLPSSDIYSLGVIAYQMLSGNPPFNGEFTQVMEAHKNAAPPPITKGKIPKSVKKAIFSALSKSISERPPSAEAFAGKLRSQAEGVWSLMGRALVLFSENFAKFILLALIIYVPMFLMVVLKTTHKFLAEFGVIEERDAVIALLELVFTMSSFFCGATLGGVVAWLVAQKMAVPMRPLELRPAFRAVKKRLRSLFGTVTFAAFSSLVLFFCFFPFGLIFWVFWSLVSPVVMLEGLKGRKAFGRSYQLVKRKFWTATGVILLSISSIIGIIIFASLLSRGMLADIIQKPQIIRNQNEQQSKAQNEDAAQDKNNESVNITIGSGVVINPKTNNETEEQKRDRRIRSTIRESVYSAVQIPISILTGVYFAIVLAFLYIQTRLAGGESLADLLEKFEQTDTPRKKWQERVRGRLINSGRITSKT